MAAWCLVAVRVWIAVIGVLMVVALLFYISPLVSEGNFEILGCISFGVLCFALARLITPYVKEPKNVQSPEEFEKFVPVQTRSFSLWSVTCVARFTNFTNDSRSLKRDVRVSLSRESVVGTRIPTREEWGDIRLKVLNEMIATAKPGDALVGMWLLPTTVTRIE